MRPYCFAFIWQLIFILLLSAKADAQTSGFIFEAGDAILDPDSNGYTSQTTGGFSGDGYDVDEFEISHVPLAHSWRRRNARRHPQRAQLRIY